MAVRQASLGVPVSLVGGRNSQEIRDFASVYSL
jgi:hypothetical protein